MIGLKSTLILALAAFSAAASIDSAVISRRQASGVTCGNNNYSSNQVQAAVDRGCSLFASGSTVGSNNYPHRFNNREQLPFPIDGPYQEFPILNNKVYTGGKLRIGGRALMGTYPCGRGKGQIQKREN